MTLTVNGQQLEFDAGVSALDVADKISKDLKKDALVARLNGKPLSLMEPIREGGSLEFVTFDDADGKWALRHTAGTWSDIEFGSYCRDISMNL